MRKGDNDEGIRFRNNRRDGEGFWDGGDSGGSSGVIAEAEIAEARAP